MSATASPASFSDFVARRFAGPGPFWTWTVFERIGGALAYGFGRLGVSPDTVTLLGGACGVAGAMLLAVANRPAHAVGAAALLLLAYGLDCADGQLARASRRASARGAWLDVAVDAVVLAFVTAALTSALRTGAAAAVSAMLGGAFGASRTASLFTSATVRREKGGIELSGSMRHLRTAFIATVDTPFVYAALCAARLAPGVLAAVTAALTAATAVQTLVSARHHFAAAAPPD
jgi:phosphatidylglycerophosphate synthase